MSVKQIETSTVVGTITLAGDAEVVLTSARVTGSPLSIAAAVDLADDDSAVAGKIRSALAFNSAVSEWFAVSGATDKVILTSHAALANDTTLNIAIDNDTCAGLTAAPTSANTLAGDGLENAYISLADFKTRFAVQGTDAARDAQIDDVIQGVSRFIDNYTGRYFYSTAADEKKYFSATECDMFFPEIDITSITTLKTDDDGDGVYETTWATTDYRTQPINRLANYTPISWITITPNGTKTFPVHYGGIEIDGKFGYCLLSNVPDVIREACYLQSFRIWMRQSAPFGVVGSSEMGQLVVIAKLDPDVELMLSAYLRGL